MELWGQGQVRTPKKVLGAIEEHPRNEREGTRTAVEVDGG